MNDNSSLRELQALRLMRAFFRIHTNEQRLELLRLAEGFSGEAIDHASAVLDPQILLSPVTFPESAN
jgi:hypothetical protein